MERQAQRWKQLKDGASRIKEETRKPDVDNKKKLSLVFEYLIDAMEYFPKQEDPQEDPEGDAVHHMVAALWDSLVDLEWPDDPNRNGV